MKKFVKLLVDHVKEDFHAAIYLSVALFITIGLVINFSIDLENTHIDRPLNNTLRIVWYFLLYSLAYYGTVFIIHYFRKLRFISDVTFWKVSLFGIGVLSLHRGFPYVYTIVRLFIDDYNVASWMYHTFSNLTCIVFITLPLLFYARTCHQDRLGLNSAFTVKPYLLLLVLIIPLIAVSAFEKGLGTYYPTYKFQEVAALIGWDSWIPVAVYETAYAVDFFNVELFFRGFLVIGLSHLMGKEALLPMVATYCFLHFGKPLGEAISSVFGGYLLGVISLYTRNIWGGVILHIGIAWTMEIAAYAFK